MPWREYPYRYDIVLAAAQNAVSQVHKVKIRSSDPSTGVIIAAAGVLGNLGEDIIVTVGAMTADLTHVTIEIDHRRGLAFSPLGLVLSLIAFLSRAGWRAKSYVNSSPHSKPASRRRRSDCRRHPDRRPRLDRHQRVHRPLLGGSRLQQRQPRTPRRRTSKPCRRLRTRRARRGPGPRLWMRSAVSAGVSPSPSSNSGRARAYCSSS